MKLNSGERQVAPTLAEIRRDHTARYEWAATMLGDSRRVVDLACGIGYGSKILAQAGYSVTAVDRSAEAIKYGKAHHAHPGVTWFCADANSEIGQHDAAVCFETIEHIEDPLSVLRNLRMSAKRLLASVPNEDVMPYRGPGHEGGYAFHFRHYTKAQFADLLAQAGWRVTQWWGQVGAESEVGRDVNGRTLIAVCELDNAPTRKPIPAVAEKPAIPKHVAIVGLGPSSGQYLALTRGQGGRHKYCDETWVINALGDVLACDRVFHMDDVRVQEIRAAAAPDSNIAVMVEWLKTHPGPIVTSRAHPNYPGLVEFPLEEVLNEFPQCYFNSTAAYAVAYAVWVGVQKISLWGCDFTYPDAHDAEKGRACVEFWLGIAVERGIQIAMPKTTSLMDALATQAERFYGFDCVDLDIKREGDRIKVRMTEKAPPTAEAVEAAYDHSRHPNALVEAAQDAG